MPVDHDSDPPMLLVQKTELVDQHLSACAEYEAIAVAQNDFTFSER